MGAAPALADKAKQRVVIQVSDGDPKNWNQALTVIKPNVPTDYGKDNVDVELVVFGHGSGMLKFESPLANRIDDTLANVTENPCVGGSIPPHTKKTLTVMLGFFVLYLLPKSFSGSFTPKNTAMRNLKQLSFFIFYLLVFQNSYADKYPRNYSVDVIHYAFELSLSDRSDEIFGKASIIVLFKQNGVKQIRLDLVNKTILRKDKGMSIESITIGNEPVVYTHNNDEVFIQLPSPSVAGIEIIFVVKYHGIPESGLRIGPTKYGDRSFFCGNCIAGLHRCRSVSGNRATNFGISIRLRHIKQDFLMCFRIFGDLQAIFDIVRQRNFFLSVINLNFILCSKQK